AALTIELLFRMSASTSSPGGFGENPFPKLCRCLTLPSPGRRLAWRITRRLLHGFSGQRLDLAVDQPESAASLPASCSCNESTSTPLSPAIIGARSRAPLGSENTVRL